MYVLVAGLRGFPNIQGGIETHCEHLYPRLVALGCEVEVIGRTTYFEPDAPKTWQGVKLTPLWAPSNPQLETLLHTIVATLYAGIKRPDVFHLHAVGPALLTPLARLMGLNVVVTHHGPDYDREKWSGPASWLLRVGERFGMRWAQSRIVISKTIQNLVKNRHGRESDLIPNGVPKVSCPIEHEVIDELGVAPPNYVLQVSRLVPEKRQLDLIEAFEVSGLGARGWRLLLVGSLEPRTAYIEKLQQAAAQNSNVVLTGFQTGESLAQIFGHAGVFVLPSSHEGLPIALLEALSYGRRVLASDIPANLEVELAPAQFFALGDVAALAAKLAEAAAVDWSETDANSARAITQPYDWDLIADRTFAVYRRSLPALNG